MNKGRYETWKTTFNRLYWKNIYSFNHNSCADCGKIVSCLKNFISSFDKGFIYLTKGAFIYKEKRKLHVFWNSLYLAVIVMHVLWNSLYLPVIVMHVFWTSLYLPVIVIHVFWNYLVTRSCTDECNYIISDHVYTNLNNLNITA